MYMLGEEGVALCLLDSDPQKTWLMKEPAKMDPMSSSLLLCHSQLQG